MPREAFDEGTFFSIMHDPQTSSPPRTAPAAITVRADWRFVLMCTAVVAMAFLGSIADVRYLNPDDRWYAAWVWSGSWLQIAYDIAVEHGRLLKPSSYTYFFPYLFDSPLYQDALRLGTTLATCLIGGYVLARLLRMRELTLLYALVFFALAQNSANLNLFVNYPFAWEFTWATWLLGTLGLIVALDRQAMRYAVVGTLVMLIGLQEGFVAYAFTLPLIVLAHRLTVRPAWRYLVPYAVGITLWLVCWVIWRLLHPSSYDGSSMGGIAHPLLALRTIVTLSLGGAPLATVFNGEVALTLHSLREHVTALWFIKMLAVGAATMVLARLIGDGRPAVPLAPLALVVLVMVFIPNVLLGLTSHYQQWVTHGVHAVHYSQFSYYAWIALLVLGLVALFRRYRSMRVAAVAAAVLSVASFVTDWSNAGFNLEQKQYARRWNTFERWLRSEAFEAIAPGARIVMNDAAITGSPVSDTAYWLFVANARADRQVASIQPEGRQEAPTHYLYLYDEVRSPNQTLLFAAIDPAQGVDRALAHTVRIYPNTSNDRLEISARQLCVGDCPQSVAVNGRVAPQLFSDALSVVAHATPDANGVPVVTIRSPNLIDLRTVRVTFPRIAPDVTGLSAELGPGFHGWISHGERRSSWAEREAQILVRNDLRPLRDPDASVLAQRSFDWGAAWNLDVDLALWAPNDQTVTVLDDDGAQIVTLRLTAGQMLSRSIPLRLEQNAASARITLRSDGPAQAPIGELPPPVFQIVGLELRRSVPPLDFEP
ncbi:MAG: hypothetical protein DI564_09890 [Rhodanobacter denitrificans]|uniref:Uncharacterized protein n=1 Tax=Rhodanobacter denitrificans TaxID=666685 RepID=A0A2W5MBM0_9GAMM|nr:MAG: hypothetical protein DI564_09890 [Rhodanobacter denitrificans]